MKQLSLPDYSLILPTPSYFTDLLESYEYLGEKEFERMGWEGEISCCSVTKRNRSAWIVSESIAVNGPAVEIQQFEFIYAIDVSGPLKRQNRKRQTFATAIMASAQAI